MTQVPDPAWKINPGWMENWHEDGEENEPFAEYDKNEKENDTDE